MSIWIIIKWNLECVFLADCLWDNYLIRSIVFMMECGTVRRSSRNFLYGKTLCKETVIRREQANCIPMRWLSWREICAWVFSDGVFSVISLIAYVNTSTSKTMIIYVYEISLTHRKCCKVYAISCVSIVSALLFVYGVQ